MHDHAASSRPGRARIGGEGIPIAPIALDDPCSVSAHVFRSLHSIIVDDGEMPCGAELAFRKGAMLTVPILWTAQDGSEPLGVMNLSERRSGQVFTAGDQKLGTAIASQIGADIQNARLVRTSLDQPRPRQAMQTARNPQTKTPPGHPAARPQDGGAPRPGA